MCTRIQKEGGEGEGEGDRRRRRRRRKRIESGAAMYLLAGIRLRKT